MNLSKTGTTICGFYGNFNLGDEAMFAGIMKLFREHKEDVDFTVISKNPEDTKKAFK